jgi:hypothetical protein
VRYRYDETKKQRWKTVELIIEKSDWEPPPPRQPGDAVVAIQVAAQEREVRRQVKAAGGKWNPRTVVWELPYGQVVALGLTKRIVPTAEGVGEDGPSTYRGNGGEYPSIYGEKRAYIDVDGGVYV